MCASSALTSAYWDLNCIVHIVLFMCIKLSALVIPTTNRRGRNRPTRALPALHAPATYSVLLWTRSSYVDVDRMAAKPFVTAPHGWLFVAVNTRIFFFSIAETSSILVGGFILVCAGSQEKQVRPSQVLRRPSQISSLSTYVNRCLIHVGA